MFFLIFQIQYTVLFDASGNKDCYRQFPKLIMPLSLPRFLLHLLVIQLATVFLPFSNTSASSSSPLVSACENAEDWKTTKLLSLGKGIGGKKNFCWGGTENERFREDLGQLPPGDQL